MTNMINNGKIKRSVSCDAFKLFTYRFFPKDKPIVAVFDENSNLKLVGTIDSVQPMPTDTVVNLTNNFCNNNKITPGDRCICGGRIVKFDLGLGKSDTQCSECDILYHTCR